VPSSYLIEQIMQLAVSNRLLPASVSTLNLVESGWLLYGARYLTEHITHLPLGVMSRLLSANDAVMALLPLVDSPPWVRDRQGGKVCPATPHPPVAIARGTCNWHWLFLPNCRRLLA
jgi:hypothetical protein